MSRKILIGDIHGCLKTFQGLLNQMNVKEQDDLYLLGDYIDRGPDSKGVIDEIIKLKNDGFKVIALRGNREQILIDNYIAETKEGQSDLGDEVLKQSFGIEDLTQLPVEYIDFCTELLYYHIEDDFIAVHAGLNFKREKPLEAKEDLLWIRNWYNNINYTWLKKKVIIHGHTPQSKSEIEAQFESHTETQVLNIDCGVLSQKKEHGLGLLCGFDSTNKELYFQENMDI